MQEITASQAEAAVAAAVGSGAVHGTVEGEETERGGLEGRSTDSEGESECEDEEVDDKQRQHQPRPLLRAWELASWMHGLTVDVFEPSARKAQGAGAAASPTFKQLLLDAATQPSVLRQADPLDLVRILAGLARLDLRWVWRLGCFCVPYALFSLTWCAF